MKAEGFAFEQSSEEAFGRGDRELSADSMRSIVAEMQKNVDVLKTQLNNYLTGEIMGLINPPTDRYIISAGGDSGQVYAQLNSRVTSTASLTNSLLTSIDATERQIFAYRVEIQKKYSIPFAAIIFVFLGAPLGMMARRGNFGVSASLSLLFFLIYWAFLITGEKLADRELLSPFMAMWLANIVLGALGVILTIRVSKESVIIDWSAIVRYLPKRWISEETREQLMSKER